MKIYIIAILAVLSFIASSSGQSNVFCGRKLAKTLALLCNNGLMGKRSDPFNIPEYENEAYSWPWMITHKARVLGTARGKRQVVTECCDKACSIDELMSYC